MCVHACVRAVGLLPRPRTSLCNVVSLCCFLSRVFVQLHHQLFFSFFFFNRFHSSVCERSSFVVKLPFCRHFSVIISRPFVVSLLCCSVVDVVVFFCLFVVFLHHFCVIGSVLFTFLLWLPQQFVFSLLRAHSQCEVMVDSSVEEKKLNKTNQTDSPFSVVSFGFLPSVLCTF